MTVYLDSCSIQRPLDDQKQIRIATEAEAILGILSLWEEGKVNILGSEILNYEAFKIPAFERRIYMLELLSRLAPFIHLDDKIENRGRELSQLGIKALDALHLASAESIKADFFCTTDDRFLKKANKIMTKVTVISPLELIKIIQA